MLWFRFVDCSELMVVGLVIDAEMHHKLDHKGVFRHCTEVHVM